MGHRIYCSSMGRRKCMPAVMVGNSRSEGTMNEVPSYSVTFLFVNIYKFSYRRLQKLRITLL